MKKLLLIIGLFMSVILPPEETSAKQSPDCKTLEQIFKTKVREIEGVCKVEIGRKNLEVTHMGKKVSPELIELSFGFNFEKVDGQTALIGEMALLQEEVNPVIDALRKGGLEITAIHNHMMYERPRIMFLHVQGKGDIVKQANTLINAVAATKELKQLQQSTGSQQ
ncbi:hypothetical protein DRW41_15415 [Neobacillus piezotolerans]|uniref:DUF1259 domain-containing protein n=1 Tax=Neobacillus piezotolerans TaxID=2259171 RepID=A0A3D8GNX0_9BACI|nr:DUF1259 domain-containing protein [Neobacillus piezotolerans]RDU35981.1 hypothetical protein DRW41_15415 [Neobacillus piezotolerans]